MKMKQRTLIVVFTSCGLFVGGCYDAEGFDPQGYNMNGYDRNGLTREASPTTRALVAEGEFFASAYKQIMAGTYVSESSPEKVKSNYNQRRKSFLTRCNQQLEHIDRMGIAQMNQPSIYDKPTPASQPQTIYVPSGSRLTVLPTRPDPYAGVAESITANFKMQEQRQQMMNIESQRAAINGVIRSLPAI